MADVYEIARAGLELAEKATPGPWREGQDGNHRVYGPDACGDYSGQIATVYKGRPNVALIAHAGTHYAALCRALLAQKAVVEAAVRYRDAWITYQDRDLGDREDTTDEEDVRWVEAMKEKVDSELALHTAVRAMKEQTR